MGGEAGAEANLGRPSPGADHPLQVDRHRGVHAALLRGQHFLSVWCLGGCTGVSGVLLSGRLLNCWRLVGARVRDFWLLAFALRSQEWRDVRFCTRLLRRTGESST